jgi:tetratricopeptide (TPR) repeat protein
MERLSSKEIQNIAELLLSPNSKNVELGKALLEQHLYAIPEIIEPIEVFLVFNPNEKQLIDWIQSVLPNFGFLHSPVFALHLALHKSDLLIADRLYLNNFLKNGGRYERWVTQYSDRAKVYSKLAGLLCREMNEHELAEKYYKIALKHLPQNADIYLSLANILIHHLPKNIRIEDVKNEVINYYNKAFELNPDGSVLYELAMFYQKHLKDLKLAEATWERCINHFPNFGDAMTAYANFSVGLKNWTKAKELAERSWKLLKAYTYKNKDEVLCTLGLIEWKGFQNHAAAEKYFKMSLKENEYYAQPLEYLCELFVELQDYAKAIKWHKRALEQLPLDILLLEELATLYLQLHDKEEAKYYFQEILEIAPNYPPALDGLKLLDQI